MEPDPTLRPEPIPEDRDRALRPQMLTDFVGQAEARANLRVFVESARRRGEAMDHALETSTERLRDHLRRPHAGQRNHLTEDAAYTVNLTDPPDMPGRFSVEVGGGR